VAEPEEPRAAEGEKLVEGAEEECHTPEEVGEAARAGAAAECHTAGAAREGVPQAEVEADLKGNLEEAGVQDA